MSKKTLVVLFHKLIAHSLCTRSVLDAKTYEYVMINIIR